MRKFIVVLIIFFNFASLYGMGMLDVDVFSSFERLNIISQTPDLNKYNTSNDAIGVFEYNEKIKNFLLSNLDKKSYRVALLAEAIIVEEKIIITKTKDGKELRPDVIRVNINNNFFNLVKTTNTRNLDNIVYSVMSNVSSSDEQRLNERRNPYKIGDKLFVLWTIYQEKGENDNLDGILVGFFKLKRDAIEFYRNSEDIRKYIVKYELEN